MLCGIFCIWSYCQSHLFIPYVCEMNLLFCVWTSREVRVDPISVAQSCLTFCSPVDCSPPGLGVNIFVHRVWSCTRVSLVVLFLSESEHNASRKKKDRTVILLGLTLGEHTRINLQFWMLPFTSRTFRNTRVLFGVICQIYFL